VLSQTMLSGTAEMSTVDIAASLQEVGGGLSVGVDADRLLVSGNALSTGLPRLLELLGDVLTGATYPSGEVAAERDRLADRIEMAESQPAHAARKALLGRLYGTHPYAVQTPEPEEVRGVRAPALRTLHASRVLPAGALLVLVGDVSPARALDAVEAALDGWAGSADVPDLRPAPEPEPGPLWLVDRPGSVQSSLRLALGGVDRAHADYQALQLANLVFGGYFSSRLVENIREDKGYTYSPHSSISHLAAGSVTVVDADVATEVTAPALLEIGYELGRIASLPVTQEELDQARQYATGTLQLSVASQGGLAATLLTLTAAGLGLDWLYDQPARLAAVTVEDVHAAATRYLAPARAVTVVLGDASVVRESVSALGPVEEA
jgi:predicted Zn-dependent peptidase